MPTLRLTTAQWANAFDVVATGGPLSVPQVQFRCFVRFPNSLLPKDAVIDTGAPLTFVPEDVWRPLRPGMDYEWLPFVPGAVPPLARLAGWQFAFEMARFLGPVSLLDYATEVPRPGVIAAFATGNPRPQSARQSLPPIVIGLWGGLLEGGSIGISRDPATGRARGELAFV